MKKKIPFLFLLFLFIIICCSCSIIKVEEESAKPIEYTIVNEDDIPDGARELIRERKEHIFYLTYQSGDDLYLIKGYGQQMTGGYSIQIKSLKASSSGIFLKTCLFGPEEAPQYSEPSYPYIIVKIAYQDLPVEFEEVRCNYEEPER